MGLGPTFSGVFLADRHLAARLGLAPFRERERERDRERGDIGGYIGIMAKKMEATNMGITEKKMETTI